MTSVCLSFVLCLGRPDVTGSRRSEMGRPTEVGRRLSVSSCIVATSRLTRRVILTCRRPSGSSLDGLLLPLFGDERRLGDALLRWFSHPSRRRQCRGRSAGVLARPTTRDHADQDAAPDNTIRHRWFLVSGSKGKEKGGTGRGVSLPGLEHVIMTGSGAWRGSSRRLSWF